MFLLCIQRSGSSLLQRMLASHSAVASHAETWLLVPQLYALEQGVAVARYHHHVAQSAHRQLALDCSGGVSGYYECLREFAENVYDRLTPPAKHLFVDKSPGYAGVASHLLKMFPNGKFIFLWRNPLAIVDSWVRVSRSGRWRVGYLDFELEVQLPHLVDTYSRADLDVACLRYEDLVAFPDESLKGLCEYLEIPFESRMLTGFGSTDLGEGPGAHTKTGSRLRRDGLVTWKAGFRRPIRRRWARRYLAWLGEDRLATMGYSSAELEGSLSDGRHSPFASLADFVDAVLDRRRIKFGGQNTWD